MDAEGFKPKRVMVDEEGPCDECKGASLTVGCCRAASKFWCSLSSSNVPEVWHGQEHEGTNRERMSRWLMALESSCDDITRLASVFPYNSVPHLDEPHLLILHRSMDLLGWYLRSDAFPRVVRLFRVLSLRLVGVLLACEPGEGPCMKLGDLVDQALTGMWDEFDMGNAGEGSDGVRIFKRIRFWDYMVYRSECDCYGDIDDLFEVVTDKACGWVLPTARQVRAMAESIGGRCRFHSLVTKLMAIAPSTLDELRPEHINWDETDDGVTGQKTLYLDNYSGLTDSRATALLDAFGPEKVSFFGGSWDAVMSALRFHEGLGRRYGCQWVCIKAKTDEEVLSIARSFFAAPLWWANNVMLSFDGSFDTFFETEDENVGPLDMGFVSVVELAESVVGVGNALFEHPAFKAAHMFLDKVGRNGSVVATR
jgi:hypothetical protein